MLFRARDLDAPAKKRARGFDWQRPGIREAYELFVVSLVASGVAVIMGAVSTGQTDSATALGYTCVAKTERRLCCRARRARCLCCKARRARLAPFVARRLRALGG